eukprot:m.334430 g.334430  ORF g.334430 m.334430 type:complete len:302 (+) comp17350_c1_seq1:134-1039(+)
MMWTKVLSIFAFVAVCSSTWITVPNTNLDIDGKCGCHDGSCHDVPGYHFVGTLSSASACETTCKGENVTQNKNTSKCSMWFWSKTTNHCWWKLGSDWEEKALASITAGCNNETVPRCGQAPLPPSPPPPPPPLPPGVPCTGSSSKLETTDCNSWQDLYHATRGNSWLHTTVFTDPCSLSYGEYSGVQCSGGNIVGIVLPANNLTGYLPTSLGNFTALQRLQVPYNWISGDIPSTLVTLAKMTTFDVTCNTMSGVVPHLPFQQYTEFCGISDHHCTEPYATNDWKCPLPPNISLCPDALCSK